MYYYRWIDGKKGGVVMDIFKTLFDGVWNNVLNRSLSFGSYSFPLWIPSAFAIVCALVIRFLGGGRSE